jgi:hypothetical protein
MSSSYDLKIYLVKNHGDHGVLQEKICRNHWQLDVLTNCIRSAIAYAVSKSSEYIHNHGTEHCDVIPKLLRFLKCTINFSLSYCDYPAILKIYCDVNCIFIQMSKTY